MFKTARWRSDKNKVKAVFKLQFHATQLTQLRGDALTISVIPADVGKPTSRLEKAKVKDGSCFWEKPHYETVKFNQDPRTGKIHEKIYHFVVATGSSKVGIIGEVSIDFASYSEATKLSSLSLPLKNENSAAVLHVSIQRVHDPNDQREVDQHDASITPQDRSLRAKFSNGEIEGSMRINPTEDPGTLSENINRDRRASSGSDITLSSSDSSSGLDTPRESEPKNTKPTHESSTPTTIFEEQHQRSSQWDWLDGSAPELSTDDSSISPREPLLREISGEGSAADVINKLKSELAALARQAELSDLELQTLRKQIVKESKKGQDLLKEIVTVKEQRDALKEECEKFRANNKRAEVNNNMLLIEEGDPWALLRELRQELNYERDLNLNLRLQLQKTQESNAELILAVQDLDEMLEQKDMETSKSKYSTVRPLQGINAKSETDDDEEQKALEEIVREHNGGNEAYLLEQKIMDLYGELELCKRDKDELEVQMEQLALDYEILTQENHDMSYKLEQSQLQEQLKMQYECTTSYATVNELETQIESLDNELKAKSKELTESLLAIKELETHVKNLEEDLDNQAHGFEADLEDLMREKVEQEQRAIRAEENLRKTRLQNAHTAERLQEEFRRLSTQMSSTFEANEKVAMKAMDEANQLRVEKRHLEEVLEKVKEDFQYLGDHYEEKLVDLSDQITLKWNQLEKMQKQIVDMSREFEHQKYSYRAEIGRLKAEKQNLEGDRKKLENGVYLTKLELESSRKELADARGANDDKGNEIKRLQSEVERLKSRCSDMKESLIEYESEKEKLRKQVSQLKGDLKKKEEAFNSIEKKLKDSNNRLTALEGSKPTTRNNKPASVPPRSSKELTNLKDRIKLLEDQIKLKEAALESSETSFLEKEKDLQHKIEDLERRLEVLYQNTEDSQVSSSENSIITTTTSHDAVLPETNQTEDQDNFDVLSNEMELLKSRNTSMEVELKEMQERYSEISLKFAEVEGERQQLVMTLRNLKNAKKC